MQTLKPEGEELNKDTDSGSLDLVNAIAEMAWEKKALDLVALRVSSLVSYCDYFMICSGRSDRHVKAIADNIEKTMKELGVRAVGVEGYRLGHWILLDYSDIVIHVFYEPIRHKYNLEGLWHDAVNLELQCPDDLGGESHNWGAWELS